MTPTPEEIEQSVSRFRDREFAGWLAVTIGLAAEQAPDVLKAALAKLFDFSAIEQRANDAERRANEAFAHAQSLVIEANHLIVSIHERFDAAEKRFDAMAAAYKELKRKVKA